MMSLGRLCIPLTQALDCYLLCGGPREEVWDVPEASKLPLKKICGQPVRITDVENELAVVAMLPPEHVQGWAPIQPMVHRASSTTQLAAFAFDPAHMLEFIGGPSSA